MSHRRQAAQFWQTKAAKKQNLSADYIKQNLTPRDFYRHELPDAKLKRPGWNDGGLCPFHGDNKPGSFRVNLTTGAYKCFACGAAGGDIIGFAMDLYAMQFGEALGKLADDWGLVWQY
jgi:DNA primase